MFITTHKKVLSIIFIIAVLAGLTFLVYSSSKSSDQITTFDECAAAGYPIMESYPPQCRTPDGRTFVAQVEDPRKTVTDPVSGISFKYPEQLSATYITTVDWPPQARVVEGSFSCTEAGLETERAGKTEQRTIGNQVYCITKLIEGAAGSMYTQYAYAFEKGSDTIVLTFSIKEVQCANYNDPQKIECENERAKFDIDGIVNQIAESISY